MAYHYYQLDVGSAYQTGVTATTSPSTQVIALRVQDGVSGLSGNKFELLRAIEILRSYIESHDAPA